MILSNQSVFEGKTLKNIEEKYIDFHLIKELEDPLKIARIFSKDENVEFSKEELAGELDELWEKISRQREDEAGCEENEGWRLAVEEAAEILGINRI